MASQPPRQAHTVNNVNNVTHGESDSEAAFLATERAALMAEGERLDARAVVPHRLPPSWAEVAIEPTAGASCVCCRGGRWWTEAESPKGWRCCICHPPMHLPAESRREIVT
jgi:hypothetical protein